MEILLYRWKYRASESVQERERESKGGMRITISWHTVYNVEDNECTCTGCTLMYRYTVYNARTQMHAYNKSTRTRCTFTHACSYWTPKIGTGREMGIER